MNATNIRIPAVKARSRVVLSEDGEHIEFHFPYSFEEREFVKNTLGAWYQGGTAKYLSLIHI